MDFPKSVPGVGLVNNQFVDEDSAAGTPGSLIPAKWGNDVTKEIIGVLNEAGIVPDEENPQQMRVAIKAIVNNLIPSVASKAESENGDESTADNYKRMTPLRVLQAIKARLVAASEVVSGVMRIGTNAEINSGTLDTVAVTPKKLRLGFSSSIGVNGYIAFPTWLGGFVIQWVKASNPNAGQITVTLPVAFQSAKICELVTPIIPGPQGWDVAVSAGNTSLSQSTFHRRSGNGTSTNSPTAFDVFCFFVGY